MGLMMPATEKQVTEKQLSDELSNSVAIRVREELARRRISRRMALVTRRTWPLIQTLNRFG